MIKTNLSQYGFTFDQTTKKQTIARVLAVHRDRYEIVCDHGHGYARLKTKEYYLEEAVFPTVGDFVSIRWEGDSDSLILSTLPRKTLFSRREPGGTGREQAVAANFDTVFILQSVNQDFNPNRLERYLTLAHQSGGNPVILLTKIDLTENFFPLLAKAERIAEEVPVLPISAKSGEGLSDLQPYLTQGQTVVFLGSSGVGKSSLLNVLAGKQLMETGSIREDDSHGRHTTTHRQLFLLQSGAMVIDTPGMRELGMWDVTEGIHRSFADVEQFLGRCRFSDCKHQTEPGCAVKAAIASGELPEERWEHYQQLKREARFSDAKDAHRARMQSKCKSKHKLPRRKGADENETI